MLARKCDEVMPEPAAQGPALNELAEMCANSALYAWTHGNARCGQQPTFAYVNLTNICNYRCVMCGYKDMMRPDKGFMDLDTLGTVMEQLPRSVYRIWLMKQGESLLHPRFGDMLAYMKKARPEISLQLATNASMMSASRCRALVEHMDYLDIGVHGTDAATLKSITRTGNLPKVMENIKRLDTMIGETGSSLTYNLTYVRQPHNEHESDEQVIDFFASRLGNYNNIVIKWESNFQGNITEANLRATQEVPFDKFPKCSLPYVVITVLHDGRISYCPAEAEERVFLGDIGHNSLGTIWNAPPMAAFRRALAVGDYHELESRGMHCQDCSWPWSLETTNLELFVDPASKELLKDLDTIPRVSAENLLRAGLIHYLNANTGEAWEMFHSAASMASEDEATRALARRWVEEVQATVSRRYESLEIWESSLNRQGRSLTEFRRKVVSNPRKG